MEDHNFNSRDIVSKNEILTLTYKHIELKFKHKMPWNYILGWFPAHCLSMFLLQQIT